MAKQLLEGVLGVGLEVWQWDTPEVGARGSIETASVVVQNHVTQFIELCTRPVQAHRSKQCSVQPTV